MSIAAKSRHVLLLGIDGGTFSVLDPLMSDGTMPFLQRLTRSGARAVLRSTAHPLTPSAWTTVATGRGPGEHGIFDFVRVDLDGPHPTYTLATSTDIRVQTLWSYVNEFDRRATVLNFPCTFPAPRIDGVVVPGYVPRNYLPRAVRPRKLYEVISSRPEFSVTELAIDWSLERKAVQGLPPDELEDWVKFHIARERQWLAIAEIVMERHPSALTAVLLDGTDRIQHLCYHLLDPAVTEPTLSPAERRLRDLCLEYFRLLDFAIERIAGLAGPEATTIVVSDHGFAAAGPSIFYVNTWLERQGMLVWAAGVEPDRDGRLARDDHVESSTLFDWSRTSAFALTSSSNGIFIRRSSAPGEAGVTPDDYPRVRRHLIEQLLMLVDPATGQPLLERVMTREEAYPGSDQGAPDLTLVFKQPNFHSVLRSDSLLTSRPHRYATHHPDGVLVLAGPGVRQGSELPPQEVAAVAPTVLYGLDLPVPDTMDEPPILGAFEPSALKLQPVQAHRDEYAYDAPPEADSGYDATGEAEVLDRLKALGYVE